MPSRVYTGRAISAAVCMFALSVVSARAQGVTASDVFAPHVSTLAANAGELVALHVHRKVATQPAGQVNAVDRVVLFVHGATTPAVPAFGFDHKDYNWMAFLARAGFDVWAMDMTGYGSSPRPMMDDPCNVDPKQQQILLKRPLAAPCAPHYSLMFKTVRNDWDEIDSVVDHIRRVTGAAKVSLASWSAGGPRAGGYAALHPDKINRVVLYAPGAVRSEFNATTKPEAGVPIRLQTRTDLEKTRWDPDVRCTGQVEPGVRDALWTQIMQWDHVGASWGPEEGVMRAPTLSKYGWSPEMAGGLKMPVMVIVGEYDNPAARRSVFDAAGSADKVFLKVACASHFILWEKQHKVLHNASLEWLRDGKFGSATRGVFDADAEGKVTKAD